MPTAMNVDAPPPRGGEASAQEGAGAGRTANRPRASSARAEEGGVGRDASASRSQSSKGSKQAAAPEWELKHVCGAAELNTTSARKCMAPGCNRLASSKWVSDQGGEWWSCVDDQKKDFKGWPDGVTEPLPITYLSAEDRTAIIQHCSARTNPAMPDVPTEPPAKRDEEKDRSNTSATAATPARDATIAEGLSSSGTTLNVTSDTSPAAVSLASPPAAAPTAGKTPSGTAPAATTAKNASSTAADNPNLPRSTSSSNNSGMIIGRPKQGERVTIEAVTTARKKSKKKKRRDAAKGAAIRKGKRVEVKRSVVVHALKADHPAYAQVVQNGNNDYNYYGTVESSKQGNGLYNIRIDEFPTGNNELQLVRKCLHVLHEGEDEPAYDRIDADAEEVAEKCASTEEVQKGNHEKESIRSFLELPVEARKTATTFECKFGPGEKEAVTWTILADDEQITEDAMDSDLQKQQPLKKDIPWNPDENKVSYNQIFFDHFFPDLTGKAAVLDKYLGDPRCSCYATVVHDKIKFHRPEHDDPDHLLKLCFTLMVAAALEVDKGVENLWKQGNSKGLKPHANFGQYIPKSYFKAFMAGAAFLWSDERYWYMNPKDMPWDVVLPFVDEYNEKRRNLLLVIFLILDEAMSGWRPKTSKTGNLPNISYEERKPVPLGTLIRDAVEGRTGIFAFHDIVQDRTSQAKKKYTGEQSSMPKGEPILAHVAECLRQVEGAGVVEGGWVGGDAWFGSINSAVELMKRKKVHSTFIVKQQLQYFPMEVLRAVLLARYPDRPGGHWAVMKANISGVDLYIMAYAWSAKGISFMVSTCGKTIRHSTNYYSSFEDSYGHVVTKELARPAIAHMLYEFLPLIDEHNKARQSALALEKCWLTTSGFFRVLTTFVGMAVVDIQRWDRSKRSNGGEMCGPQIGEEDDFCIKEIVNLICKPLRTGELKYREAPQPSMRRPNNGDSDGEVLTRIRGEDGSTCYPRDDKQRGNRSRQRTCFICRRYNPKAINTQWMCRHCGMALCSASTPREYPLQEEHTCLAEHLASDNPVLGCGMQLRSKTQFIMPDKLKLYKKDGGEKAARDKEGDDEAARVSPDKRPRLN